MSVPAVVTITVPANLGAAERAVIEATLKHFNGHRERTAVCLGISLKTLYNRLQQYREDDAAARIGNATAHAELVG